MDVIRHIDELMRDRGWNDSSLSARTGIPRSTIANFRRRGSVPSIYTLTGICDAFGITLAQFFNEDGKTFFIKQEDQDFLYQWSSLTEAQKAMISGLMKEMK